MTREYTIEKVSQEVGSFEAHGKEFKSYTLKLVGLEQPVQMNQLSSTTPPKEGDELYGDIDMSSSFGPKFKKAQKEGGGFRKPQGDSFAMFLSYAKDIAIAIMQNSDDGKWNQNQFDTVMDSVSQGAHVLWSNRPDSTSKTQVLSSHPEADTVVEVKDDIKLSDIPF